MMGFTRFFPATRAEREQSGDPRASIEERYASKEIYLRQVREAAMGLVHQRYMLAEDVEVVLQNASARYDAALNARSGV
jgi:hypothetical protein